MITVTSVAECDRAITAALLDGAPAVRIVRNGVSSWVYSHATLKALIAQRKAKRRRQWWWWWTKTPAG